MLSITNQKMESKHINDELIIDVNSMKEELADDEKNNVEIQLPNGILRLETQVAGHPFDPMKNTTGMLRCCNGCILKPGEKEILQEREIMFYEKIQSSDDSIFSELSNFTPKYYGTVEFNIMNEQVKFLKLQDITDGMMEPCVMDIKIGKRTWDPLADSEKREKEMKKYAESKEAFGFCIPGFQVYNLTTGNLTKYNKDYGKKLNAKTVIEAIKIFLNLTEQPSPCREFVIKLLSPLWKILAFFRLQKKLRFYSSSILIAYDVKRLRQLIRLGMTEDRCVIKSSPINVRDKTTLSPMKINDSKEIPSNKGLFPLSPRSILSQITKKSKKKNVDKSNELKRSVSDMTMGSNDVSNGISNLNGNTVNVNNGNINHHFNETLDVRKLCRTHSYGHNYERDMIEMKDDYAILLQELTGESKKSQDWVRVYMIDFVHVFPAENESLDNNYLEGIENLIKIFESLLIVK
ncbi:hypothetical protein PV327_005470 [Microctonus hyperodae]|uniref:Kinase n=1 Tax=Microctonus hyperodae TaxID=165561 RepID=A0AA39G1Q1_MICHY|nr:hypothetical protein PV327_005470 [Microctonus hyperodae]